MEKTQIISPQLLKAAKRWLQLLQTMGKLNVKHYLGIYKLRQEMQEKGITNPSEKIKRFTCNFVEKLMKMKPEEEITIRSNTFIDSSNKLIIEIPKDDTLDFFLTTMPQSRKADYYLGYYKGSVYFDFNISEGNLIKLIRVSFDGYGCFNFEENSLPLNKNDSTIFIELMKENELKQVLLNYIVLKSIELNRENLPEEALKEYHLITFQI